MNRKRIGQILFWLGVIFMIISYILLWVMHPSHSTKTSAELSETIWAMDGFLFRFRGMSTLFGPHLALIGVLLYSGNKRSYFWLWGLVPFISFALLMIWMPRQHIPAFYGTGAGFIIISYLGILWIWGKTHNAYNGIVKTGKLIQLLGYSFLFITALLLCLYVGQPHLLAMAENPVVSGESILVSVTLGWLLLFLGDYLPRTK